MIATIFMGTAKTLMVSLFTERMILKVMLMLAEWACARTSNSIDDKLVEDIKSKLQADGKI